MIKDMRPWAKGIFFAVLAKAAGLFKINFILGSHHAFFSGISVVAPLAGAFAGISGSFVAFGISILIGFIFYGFSSLSFLAFYVPGLCASLYWASPSKMVRVILPVLCMLLFWSHPVGGQAFIYALYWCIPIILYFVRPKLIFLEALGSTFVAHAVGSVIWLYTVPMTSAHWISLMPIVMIERMLFASGMVIAHTVISWAFAKITQADEYLKRFLLVIK